MDLREWNRGVLALAALGDEGLVSMHAHMGGALDALRRLLYALWRFLRIIFQDVICRPCGQWT